MPDSDAPVYSGPNPVPYRDRTGIKGWKRYITMVVVAFLLLSSGYTIITFITMIEKEVPEKRGVVFPFDREVIVQIASPDPLHRTIENAVNRHDSRGSFVEIVLQDGDIPLFVNEVLRETGKELPAGIADRIDGFSIGGLEGDLFLLISFDVDAYSLMSKQYEDILESISHFTGRSAGQEQDRLKRASTIVVLTQGGTVYGFLNTNTVAITTNTENFLSLVDRYRSF